MPSDESESIWQQLGQEAAKAVRKPAPPHRRQKLRVNDQNAASISRSLHEPASNRQEPYAYGVKVKPGNKRPS